MAADRRINGDLDTNTLTAIYNLAGSLLRIPSGIFADALGYAGYFALTGAFALPAFAFLPRARRWLSE